MRQVLNNVADFNPLRFLSNTILVLLGLLIITGGRIGIQATPESEVRWIEAFANMDKWIGWALIWLAADDMLFRGKATLFLLSKTVIPVVETILKVVLGEDKLSRLLKRFEKKIDKRETQEEDNGH